MWWQTEREARLMQSFLLPLTCNSQGGLASQIRFYLLVFPCCCPKPGAALPEEADYGGIAES